MRRSPSSLVNRSMTAPEDPSSVHQAGAWLTARTFVSPMRYAMFNAAPPDTTDESSRSVSLSCSRPRPEMPGCSIKTTGLPRHWHGTATPNPSTSKRPTPTSPSNGRGNTASRAMRSSTGHQDARDPSHPRIPHAEVGARRVRRARQLKFQIFLARVEPAALAGLLLEGQFLSATIPVVDLTLEPGTHLALDTVDLGKATFARLPQM